MEQHHEAGEDEMIWDHRKIEDTGSYDVIVVGGGIAGVAAAVSATREGARTLLLEKQVNLGGLATVGLISFYEPLCDGKGEQVIFGIAEELIRLAVRYGFDTLPAQWGGDKRNRSKNARYDTCYSPCLFAMALDEYLIENHVNILFDAYVTCPVMEERHCVGVIVETVERRCFFGAKVVIDTTGDATVLHRAGVPTILGRNYMSYIAHGFDYDSAVAFVDNKDISGFRKWRGVGSDMLGNGHPADFPTETSYDAERITAYLLYGRKALLEQYKKTDRNTRDIMMLPTMPQFRTIRRIVGAGEFRAEEGRRYPDAVGWVGDFRPKGIGKRYQIPYAALYHQDFDNLLAAGRIISAPEGDGWEVARVIPSCAVTGQAAGIAAALSAAGGIPVPSVTMNLL